MLPDLDWSFLDSRSRELSVKARENARQQQNKDGDDNERKRDEEYGRGRILQKQSKTIQRETYIYEHDARVARDRAAKTSMAHMTGLSGREVKEDSNWCL